MPACEIFHKRLELAGEPPVNGISRIKLTISAKNLCRWVTDL